MEICRRFLSEVAHMIFRWKVLGAFRFRKHEVFSGIDEVKAGGCGCMQVVVGVSSHASDFTGDLEND